MSIIRYISIYFQKGDVTMYRLLELNPQLQSFAGDIDLRMFLYRATKARILTGDQTLNDFANAHNYYGFRHVDGGWYYREWAPSPRERGYWALPRRYHHRRINDHLAELHFRGGRFL